MNERLDSAVSSTEEKLASEGWVKQFTCGEPRLSESCDLFSSMGREIHLEKIGKEDQPMGSECDSCFIACSKDMRTIWTRSIKNNNDWK